MIFDRVLYRPSLEISENAWLYIDFSSEIWVLLVLILSTISQTIFGVGILLWGTPLLLLMDYTFIETLSILLPISLIISALQFSTHLTLVDWKLFTAFAVLALPGIVLGIFLVTNFDVIITLLVAIVLIFGVISRSNSFKNEFHTLLMKFNYLWIFLIGLIHGTSNLGGSLLVLRISFEGYTKIQYRTMVSGIYFIFAFSQIISILSLGNKFAISIFYVAASITTYFISNKIIFSKITETNFASILDSLMLIMACLLLIDFFGFIP